MEHIHTAAEFSVCITHSGLCTFWRYGVDFGWFLWSVDDKNGIFFFRLLSDLVAWVVLIYRNAVFFPLFHTLRGTFLNIIRFVQINVRTLLLLKNQVFANVLWPNKASLFLAWVVRWRHAWVLRLASQAFVLYISSNDWVLFSFDGSWHWAGRMLICRLRLKFLKKLWR
jgi:hypothetical protein